MVSRNRGFPEDDTDVLLFTTMCIVGHHVDVFVKDGSLFSGTFHTASLHNNNNNDNDYAIVLKKAIMIKKGNRETNVANKGVIETLIVQSQDLVQVVSKGVSHSDEGFTGSVSRDDVGATSTAPPTACTGGEAQAVNNVKRKTDRKSINQTRVSSKSANSSVHSSNPKTTSHVHHERSTENEKNNSIGSLKKEEVSNAANNDRHVGDGGTQQKQGYHEELSECEKELNILEVQRPGSRIDAFDNHLNVVTNTHKVIASKALPDSTEHGPACSIFKLDGSKEMSCSKDFPPGASTAVSAVTNVTSESYLSSSSIPTEKASQKGANLNKTAKDFKLNPGAKIFSPSFSHQSSVTPPVVPTSTYIPDASSIRSISTAQPEVKINQYASRSLPMKFIHYSSLVSSNGAGDVQHPQPAVGHLGSRTQPLRYGGQYHPVQPGTTYVTPPSQNVMVGRLGPIVYMHPLSHDVVQGAAAFSQVPTFPLLTTPHQVHFPKHQGSSTTAQALQLCSTPPFVAAVQQPFTVPSHIPISQPHFAPCQSPDLMVSWAPNLRE